MSTELNDLIIEEKNIPDKDRLKRSKVEKIIKSNDVEDYKLAYAFYNLGYFKALEKEKDFNKELNWENKFIKKLLVNIFHNTNIVNYTNFDIWSLVQNFDEFNKIGGKLVDEITEYSIDCAQDGFEAGVDSILLLERKEPIFGHKIREIHWYY